MAQTVLNDPAFRRDIQGLRAVAVVSVALGHAQVGLFAGGFVGVDVFFVISGFLITQLLLSEASRTGRISLPAFYSRRARRILPAATLVTLVSTLASVLLLDYVRATAVVGDAVWATFFAANIHFGRVGTDYFAAGSPPSPLQHYWSLAIEEQFYLVWPVLLAVLYGGYARWRRTRGPAAPGGPARVGRAPLLAVLVAVGGGSLAWSLHQTAGNATGAYFSTPARVWELAMGAACAVLAPRLASLDARARATAAWVGLALIGVAVVGFSAATPYPGSAALVPVVGAALVLAGGCGPARGGPAVLLARRPCQAVGDWSYSLYLWHWPFLVIGAGYVGHDLTTGQNLLLLGAATVASYVTFRWVENPFRRSSRAGSSRRRGLALYPVATALALLGCLGDRAAIALEVASAPEHPPITLSSFGETSGDRPLHLSSDPAVALVQVSAAAARDGYPIPSRLRPSLLDLADDQADVGGCDYADPSVRAVCPRGDVTSDRVLVLFGDSHAKFWIPALDPVAKAEGYRAYYFVKPRCGAGIEAVMASQPGEEDHLAGCAAWQSWVMDQVADLQPEVVIASADTVPVEFGPATGVDPAVTAEVHRGLDRTVTDLMATGGRLVVIGDTPGVPRWPGSCLAERDATLLGCSLQLDAPWARSQTVTREVARAHAGDYIDPTRWFCADRVCPAVVGSMVTYRDPGHVSTAYARHLSSALGDALALAGPR